MPNAWVEFVRQYAKENNLSYGCAISEASSAYRKMKQEAKTPKTPTKKRITIKPKAEQSKAELSAKESVEYELNNLKTMKEKEDEKLVQSDFYKYQYLAWFENSNDISRSNKYKKLQKRIKEECSKLTYPNTNFDCEAIFIEDIDYYFKRDLDYYTMKIFPKILKRIKMPNYKIPTETNKNKNKKNDEDFIKEFAENNDMTIKEAVGQLKTVFL